MRAARETQRGFGMSLSRSDGEPAQHLLRGCAVTETAVSQRRTHCGVTVGASSRAVQDTIGSTVRRKIAAESRDAALLGLSRYVGGSRAGLARPLSWGRRVAGRRTPISRLLVVFEVASFRLIAVLFTIWVSAVGGIRHELAIAPRRRNANETYRQLPDARTLRFAGCRLRFAQ